MGVARQWVDEVNLGYMVFSRVLAYARAYNNVLSWRSSSRQM